VTVESFLQLKTKRPTLKTGFNLAIYLLIKERQWEYLDGYENQRAIMSFQYQK